MATVMRFVLLGDEKDLVRAFNRTARASDNVNRSVGRQSAALKANKKQADTLGVALNKLGGSLIGYGGATDVANRKTSYFAKGLAAVNLATGLAEPLVSSLVVATGGLAAAFTAAGAGLGAYGLALAPFLAKQKKATQLQAQAMAGSKKAQQDLKDLMKTMPPAFKDFNKAVGDSTTEYMKWSRSLAAPVLNPLTNMLKVTKPALAALTPLVKAAGSALGVLTGELAKKIQGGGIERVVSVLLPHVKPVIVDLGHAIGNVIAGVWGVIKAFVPFSDTMSGGLADLTEKFKVWANTLSGHTGFHAIVQQWRDDWPLIKPVLENFAKVIKNILSSMAGMATPANSRALWQIANPLMALAVSLSSHPLLVRTLLYLLLIGKGSAQIKGVFGAMRAAWSTLAVALAKMTGGRISLGGQMVESSSVMMAASRNQLAAAETMLAASGVGGKAAAGAAGAAGAGAVGRKAAAGGVIGWLTSTVGGKWIMRAGIATLITEMLVKPILQKIPSGKGKNWWDDPGGILKGMNSWHEVMKSAGEDLTIVGKALTVVTGGLTHAGDAAGGAAGKMSSLVQPINDLTGKSRALAREGGPVANVFNRQGTEANIARGALNDYTSAIHTNGLRSRDTHAARDRLVNDMISAGVKGKAARKDVNDYTAAIRNNGYGSNQARAARQHLITDIENAFKRSQQGKRDMTRYTDAVRINGEKSNVAKQARHTLIKDLENAGLTSKEAHRLVNGLTNGILGIPKKHSTYLKFGVNVPRAVVEHYPSAADMRAAGFATGGPVHGPGGPTGDRVPLMGSAGEWMIKASSASRYGPKAMASVNDGTATVIPGYAAGGPLLPPGPQLAKQMGRAPGGTYGAGRKPTETFALKLWQVWIDLHSGGMKAVREAMKWIGQVPYVWGGMAVPGGADCSGFVSTVYRRALGIIPPRTSEAQYAWVRRTGPQPGGLAFYTNPGGGTPPGHVALVKDATTVISQGGPGRGPIVIGLHGPGPLMGTGVPPGGFSRGGGAAGQYAESQLGNLWIQAGGPRRVSHLAAAIAEAESGGNPRAHNPSGAAGLWQILGLPFPGNPYIPLTNARMAVAKYHGAGNTFLPWVAYTSGAYRQFMHRGGYLNEDVVGVGASTGREYGFQAGESVDDRPETTRKLLAAVLHELRQINGHTRTGPERTGAATAKALNGGARRVALERG